MNTSDRNNLPLGQYTIIITGTNWTTVNAIAVPYRLVDGTWRVILNINGGSTVTSSLTVDVDGLVFADGIHQSMSCKTDNGAREIGTAFTEPNTNTFKYETAAGAQLTGAYISGDVALASKPSFVE